MVEMGAELLPTLLQIVAFVVVGLLVVLGAVAAVRRWRDWP